MLETSTVLLLCLILILLGITYHNKNILSENFIDPNKLYDRTTCNKCISNDITDDNDNEASTASNNATKRFSRLYRHTLGLKNAYDTKFCSSGNPILKDPCTDILSSSQAYIPKEIIDECKRVMATPSPTPNQSSKPSPMTNNAFKELLYKYAILTSGRTNSPNWFSSTDLQYT
jgi:hypothetical protein